MGNVLELSDPTTRQNFLTAWKFILPSSLQPLLQQDEKIDQPHPTPMPGGSVDPCGGFQLNQSFSVPERT